MSDRDAETVRRMYRLLRFFKRAVTRSCEWHPFYPGLRSAVDAQASMFGSIDSGGTTSSANGHGTNTTESVLWTVVSTEGNPLLSVNISIESYSAGKSWRFFDVWHGTEILPSFTSCTRNSSNAASATTLMLQLTDQVGVMRLTTAGVSGLRVQLVG
jgi:hypothetical protein